MAGEAYQRYSRPVYQMRAESLYYHRLAGAIGRRWQRWATMSALLTAVTSSTSAIAGWALWEMPGGKETWIVVAGIAALVSIMNGVLEVPRRVKERETLRSGFRAIIFDSESLLDELLHGSDQHQAKIAFDALKKRHAEHVDRHEGFGWDPMETNGLGAAVRADVNKVLVQEAEDLRRALTETGTIVDASFEQPPK